MSKNLIKRIGNGAMYVGEKALSEIALVSALASTTQTGNIPERIAGGIYTPIEVCAKFAHSYIQNEGVRNTLNGAAINTMQAIGNIGTNISEHPQETIYSLIGAYGFCKVAPMASSYLRKKFAGKPKPKE